MRPKTLKQSRKVCSGTLQNIFNDKLKYGHFLIGVKCADETPVDDPTKPKNYRLVKFLPGN